MTEPTTSTETVSLDSLDPFERGLAIVTSMMLNAENSELQYLQEQIRKIGRNLGKPVKQRLVVGRDNGQITHAEKVPHHPSQDDIAELAGFAAGAIVAFYRLARHSVDLQKADDKSPDASETNTNTNQPKEQ